MRLLTLHKAGLLRLLVGGLVILSSGLAHSQTCVWTGAGANGKWTNPDNWRDGEIPGRINVSGGGIDGNKGDVAQFGPVADGAKTTIDLADVRSVMRLEIVSGAPVYTFGTSSSQPLRLEAHATDGETNGILIVEGVENMPVFAGNMVFFQDYMATAPGTIIENNGSGILDLKPMSAPVKDPEATVSNYGNLYHFYFKGTGDIRVNGQDVDNFGVFHFQQSGKFIVNFQLLGRLSGYHGPFGIIADGELTTPAEVVINKDCCLVPRQQYNSYITVETRDLKVGGEGWLGSQYPGNYNHIKIKTGRTFEISSGYRAINDNSSTALSTLYLEQATGYEGSLCLNGVANAMTNVSVLSRGVVEVQKIGLAGETGSFGEDSVIRFGDASTIRYVGPGETTGKAIVLQSKNNNLLRVTLCHAGTGPWNVASPITLNNKSQTLVLDGERDDATLSSNLADGSASVKLSLAKSGAGTWTIAGGNTFTGATTLNAGTLKVAASGSLASSSGITVEGGTLAFEGDAETSTEQALKKITISESGTLVLSGKVTVTAGEISRTSGKVLNVVTRSPDAKLVVPVGTASGAFLWNGQPAVVDADGEVKLDADAVIAARGDVVPDNNGVVAIFYEGTTGNDRLAEDNTTLAKLIQMSDTAATVQIGKSRALSVPSVGLGSDAADLMLGATGDEGTLDSPTKTIAYDNASAESKIVVNAAIAADVTNSLEKGAVVFKGGTSLSRTTIATVDKAKAQLEIRDCDVETGIEPLIIGNNTGTDYSGGGMQYGEVTVSNAVICNKADIERSGTTYSDQHEYGIVVGKNASGILRVQEGSIVSNRLLVGIGGAKKDYGRGSGAVYQSGGEVVAFSPIMAYGGNSMAYYELSGGTFEVPNTTFTPGISSYAMWNQSAGTTATLKKVNPSSGNGGKTEFFIRGHVNVTDSGSRLCNGYQDGNISIFTVDGPDALLDLGSGGSSAFEADEKIQTVRFNVNDSGVLRVGLLYRNKVTSADSRFSIAFNGGIFACGASADDVFSYQGQPLDSVRIHSKGMTVDTRGMSTGTGVALTAAFGKGVAEIPFDWATFPQWNVPPFIRIDGDGDGATAHALFDSSSQCVTGIVITCSGSGYTTATATAIYVGNGCPSSKAVDCVLSDNVTTGPFTKTGTGTFTLKAENSWGGKTIASGGTLKVGCDNAIPAGASVVLAGGDIDFNDKVCSVATVTYGVGGGRLLKTGNVQLPSTFDMAITADEILSNQSVPLSGNQDLTGKTLIVTGDFSSLDPEVCRRYTVVSVTGGTISGEPTIVAPALPKGWSFVTRLNGVKLVNPLGMLMIVR